MMLKDQKTSIIEANRTHETDTGSPEVQVAILTERINILTETAENGTWEKGPGMELFNAIKNDLGDVNIIAEDLGDIFDSVKELLRDTGFPGMRVLQFGFNPDNTDNDHLPHNYPKNCCAYTGTHDNSTIMQWGHILYASLITRCRLRDCRVQ